MAEQALLCVDFGSTFTKVALVDSATGALLATTSHQTTLATDIIDGFEVCRSELAARFPSAVDAQVLACSSAGGGLRIAVVGNEELVTAEAGRRVALSSGGKVASVLANTRDGDALSRLLEEAPDVVLLTGGTDDGDEEAILAAAAELVNVGWRGPVVVAGNAGARDRVGALLSDIPHVLADNVVPRIGVLTPDSARSAIRQMFLTHVIGGKHLSDGTAFNQMLLGATPDVVLAGVEVLARLIGGEEGIVVVDVGGATTDVYSVIPIDPEEAELSREVVARTPATRTVEADLGMRWSSETTVAAAIEAGLLTADLADAGVRRSADPAFIPANSVERAEDEAIATAAVVLALRRHAGRSKLILARRPADRNPLQTGREQRHRPARSTHAHRVWGRSPRSRAGRGGWDSRGRHRPIRRGLAVAGEAQDRGRCRLCARYRRAACTRASIAGRAVRLA